MIQMETLNRPPPGPPSVLSLTDVKKWQFTMLPHSISLSKPALDPGDRFSEEVTDKLKATLHQGRHSSGGLFHQACNLLRGHNAIWRCVGAH